MGDIVIPDRPDWCLEEDEGAHDDGVSRRLKSGGRRKLPEFQNEVS